MTTAKIEARTAEGVEYYEEAATVSEAMNRATDLDDLGFAAILVTFDNGATVTVR